MAEKVLTIRLTVKEDGTVAVERLGTKITDLERKTGKAKDATASLNREQERQKNVLAGVNAQLVSMLGWLGAVAGAAGLGMLLKRGYEYNQQLEQQRIALAGVLGSLFDYRDATGRVLDDQLQFQAALSESTRLIEILDRKSYELGATVPQMGLAFTEAISGARAAGLKTDYDEILGVVTKIVATAKVFNRMEFLPQEIRALLGQGNYQDSILSRRLFGSREELMGYIKDGTILMEIPKRAEAFAAAAKEQSKTLSATIATVAEEIDSLVSAAISDSLGKLRDGLARVGAWVKENREPIVATINAIAGSIGAVISGVADWAREHANLLKNIVALTVITATVTAVVGAVSLAISVLTNPVTQLMLAIVGLALAWEALGKLGEIEVGGHKIKDYLTAVTLQLVQLAKTAHETVATAIGKIREFAESAIRGWEIVKAHTIALGRSIVGVFETVFNAVKGMFGAMVDVVLAPIRAIVERLLSLPLIGPLAAKVKAGLQEIKQHLDSFAKDSNPAAAVQRQAEAATRGFLDKFREDLARIESKDLKLPNLGEMMINKLKSMVPSLSAELQKAINDATKELDKTDKPGSGGGEISEQLLAKILAAQLKAGQKFKKWFDDARDLALEELKAYSKGLQDVLEFDLARSKELRDQKIALIKDEIEQELQERKARNADLYAAQIEEINSFGVVEQIKVQMRKRAIADLKKADADAEAEAERRKRAQIAGTKEWAEQIKKNILGAMGTTGTMVADAVEAGFGALAGAVEGFLGDLFDGFADFGDFFEDLVKSLQSIWSRMLSDMLVKAMLNGDSIATQLKAMYEAAGAGGAQGAIAGAGMGAMIGGVTGAAMGGQNYADIGGMVGGALGSFAGPIGALIGSLFGSILGGLIKKGQDWIKVSIADGIVSVTEKGLSAEGREELRKDIQRHLEKLTDSYDDLINLFPRELREQIRERIKAISMTGGVSGIGDVRDEQAFAALDDFLGEDLPAAVFEAYSDAIGEGLQLMGVEAEKVKQLMAEWGKLEGEELREAIALFVSTLVDTLEIRDRTTVPFEDRWAEASRLTNMTPLDRIKEVDDEIAKLVSSLPELDLEDQLATQQQINRLQEQRWDMELQAIQQMQAELQRIDDIQRSISESIAAQKEQIELYGMDDEGKADYIFGRMRKLRGDLLAATDPDEIQRIVQQIQSYAGQAFNLAPDNAEMRQSLLAILGDVEGYSKEQLDAARDKIEAEKKAIEEQDKKNAEMINEAAEIMLEAAEIFAGDPDAGPGDGVRPDKPVRPRQLAEQQAEYSREIGISTTELERLRGELDKSIRITEDYASTTDMARLAVFDLGNSFADLQQEVIYLAQLLKWQRDMLSQPPDGSFASGLSYVPYDNFVAELHRGERVLTTDEAASYRRGGGGVQLVQVPVPQIAAVELVADGNARQWIEMAGMRAVAHLRQDQDRGRRWNG